MKRLILLLLFPICLFGQITVSPSGGVSTVPVSRTVFLDINGSDSTGVAGDISKPVQSLATAVTKASGLTPTSANPVLIKATPGTFTITSVQLPNNVSLEGCGRDVTIFQSVENLTTGAGAILVPGNNSVIAHLQVIGTAAPGVYQDPVGTYSQSGQQDFTNATLFDVKLVGDSDAIYIFPTTACDMRVYNSILIAKFDTISVAAGTTLEVWNTDSLVTGPSSLAGGVFSRGVVSNGGICRWFGGNVEVNGGVTRNTAFETSGAAAGTVVEIYNARTKVGTSATNNYDADNGNSNSPTLAINNVVRSDGAALSTSGTITQLSHYASSGANTDITSLKASVVAYDVRAYGAKGDAHKVTDAVLNGTTTVTSSTANFSTTAVAGQVVWGIETASGTSRLPIGTISSITSNTAIVCSIPATGSYTGVSLVWGTDDTTAIQSAATAADGANQKGRVVVPAGGYVFSDRLFNQSYSGTTDSFSVIGAGKSQTFFYPTPNHAHTGSRIFNGASNASRSRFEGFTIDGSDTLIAVGNIIVSDCPYETTWLDVRIENFRNASTFVNIATTQSVFVNCEFIASQSGGNGINVNGSAEFISCYNGNHNGTGLSIAGGNVHWIGGILDECSADTVLVQGGEFISSGGSFIYAGAGQKAVEVTGSQATADARIIGSTVMPFGGNNNCTALKLSSGTTAKISNSTLTGSGTGFGVDNAGTVYDGGNNTVNSTNGTALTNINQSTTGSSASLSVSGQTGLMSVTGLTSTNRIKTVRDAADTILELGGSYTPTGAWGFTGGVSSTSAGDIVLLRLGKNVAQRFIQFTNANNTNEFMSMDVLSDNSTAIDIQGQPSFRIRSGGVNKLTVYTGGGMYLGATPADPGTSNFSTEGNITTTVIGKTVAVKSGTNAKAGTFTLSSGAATVSNTSVTANSVVACTVKTASGTLGTGTPEITINPTTGFTAAGVATDNSTYNFVILEVN